MNLIKAASPEVPKRNSCSRQQEREGRPLQPAMQPRLLEFSRFCWIINQTQGSRAGLASPEQHLKYSRVGAGY